MLESLNRGTLSLLASGAALIAGVLARNALHAGWRSYKGEDPPLQPASLRTSWADALLWAALTGLAVGLTRLIARRGVAAGWRKATGKLPPM